VDKTKRALWIAVFTLVSWRLCAQTQPPPQIDSESTGKAEFEPRMGISGTLEGEVRWMRHHDTRNNAVPSSDIYLRTFELGMETAFLDWASATAVLNSEWIDDAVNVGDQQLTVDEAHLDIDIPSTSLYMVLGKRTQPFGLFENSLVTEPITQDAYEIQKVGLSIGVRGPADLDVSMTGYKGREQMNHLFQSRILDSAAVKSQATDPVEVSSFITALSVSPVRDEIVLFGAFLSEPGWCARNTSINVGFHLDGSASSRVMLDGEYMKALQRERYAAMDHAYHENILSMSLSYMFTSNPGHVRGSGNYAARKSELQSHPVEIAVRYEALDDDGLSENERVWSVKNRFSMGGRTSFHNDAKVTVYLAVEARRTEYRVPPDVQETMAKPNDEVYVRLGIGF